MLLLTNLRAFAPFVREHSLLSTVHNFFKMEVEVLLTFINKNLGLWTIINLHEKLFKILAVGSIGSESP